MGGSLARRLVVGAIWWLGGLGAWSCLPTSVRVAGGDGLDGGEAGDGRSDGAVAVDGSSSDAGAAADASDSATPAPAWARCRVNSDCQLAPSGCCDACGMAELGQVHAVNGDFVDEHHAEVCPLPTPCPRCASMPNPWLIATCEEERCVALDLRQEPVTACRGSSCILWQPQCCQCGSSLAFELVAVRVGTSGDLAELLCDPNVDCAYCEPEFPPGVAASCNEVGRCTVAQNF